jgi:hypothetical protein
LAWWVKVTQSPVATNRLQAQATDDFDLFFGLDLEMTEGKGVLEPTHMKIDIQPDPELVHADVEIIRHDPALSPNSDALPNR